MNDLATTGATEVVEREISLSVNGGERRIPAGWTVAELLASLDLDARTVVVEHNGTILRERSSFASHELSTDDSIEIVHFVGGG
jgi:thiamine biosynthesis protein ThiS